MDVKTLCLGVLAERPMTGYEIKKLFDRGFRHFFVAGYGSIYPALAELAQAGLVTVESVDQERRPDKKVYRITAVGPGPAHGRARRRRTAPQGPLGVPGAALLRASPAAGAHGGRAGRHAAASGRGCWPRTWPASAPR